MVTLNHRAKQKQKGQVLPYVALMIFLLAGGAFVVFDVGFMINARIQSQNAADAAALAAVSVKINKHHMDSLLRTAMTQEALIAQSEIRAAQAIAVQALIKAKAAPVPPDNPDIPAVPAPGTDEVKGMGDRYKQRMNRGYKHAVKLHRESLALKAWYKWLEQSGPTVVREAARVAYALNMQGYDDLGNSVQADNINNVLKRNSDLLETGSGSNTNVGGFIYAGEGATAKGMFGKTFVEQTTKTGASAAGVALLKYLEEFEINSNAAATLKRRSSKTNLGASLSMNWYSPYLMAIEGDSPTQVAH